MPASIEWQLLSSVELFDNLTTEQLGELLAVCDEVTFAAGDAVYEVGREERALYVLLAGTVEVDVEAPRAGERTVAELGPGSVFGESSFFHASPHSATVRAQSDVRLLRLDRARFNELLHKSSLGALRVAANAAKILADRLQQADRFIVELLEQIQDDKIREAHARYRNRLGHSFRSSSGPGIGVGTMR
jgi:CRP/FNR family transcriptional regulator, cyclic AMP receptor protein